ncbi:MAG: glycosyltransferase family 39 protein [Planctomycetota bacterium]
MQSVRDVVLVVVVAVIVIFPNLGRPRLWDRDEPRNAGCAREMVERGDWVVPVFNAELRTHKPVLLYWFMMAAYSIFGVTEFAARFSSATFGVGTAVLTYLIARRMFGRQAGLWSAIILTTFVMFGVVGRAATPDSTLILFCTAAMAVFVYGIFPTDNATDDRVDPFPGSWRVAAVMYAIMGVAVLAKGPVGLVLPTAVIGMFCLIERSRLDRINSEVAVNDSGWFMTLVKSFGRWFHPVHFLQTCWHMRPITAVVAVLIVAGPWYAWVGWRTDGAWLAGFLGEHNLGRAVTAMEGHSGSTLLFYPLTLLACCFPWSVLTVPTIASSVRTSTKQPSERRRAAFVFLACWVIVYVVLFSIAQTKLPSYIAPTFPAVAILLGSFVAELIERPVEFDRRWARTGMIVLSLVGVGLSVGLNLVLRRYLPRESSLSLVMLVPVAAGVVGMIMMERQRIKMAMRRLGISAAAFSLLLFGVLSVRVSHYQEYDRLFSPLARQSTATVGSYGRLEPTWVYYAGRPIEFFDDDDLQAAVRFLAQPDTVLVTTEERLDNLTQATSDSLRVLSRSSYFLQSEKLIMVTGGQSVASK